MMSVTPLPPAPRNQRNPRGGGVRLLWAGMPLLLLALPACATKGDIRDVTDAIEGMRAQSARTDSTLMSIGLEIGALQDTLETEAGRGVDSRGGIARELRSIHDQLNRLEQLTGQIQAQVSRLDTRVTSEMRNIRQLPTTVLPDSTAEALRNTSGTTSTSDPDAVFVVALRMFNSGSLTTARAGFQQFLQVAPTHARAPDAYFNLGDIASQEDRLDDAVATFLRIPELFPESSVVPRALYRAGTTEHDRGNDTEATTHLQRLVNSYPDSDVTGLARDLLEEIG